MRHSLTGVSDELVRVATDRGVTTLTLDSPHNRNALSTPLLTRLREALAAAVSDPSVRVVVLDHAGPAFCSGVDLAEAEAARRAGRPPVAVLGEALADLWECPKPVVVRMFGPARAGGVGLVAAADIAVCATDVTFAFTEVRLGVVPAVISAVVLPRLTSRAAARLYLTGEVFDAEQAAAVGLISAAVPATQLDSTVAEICADLLQGAPAALAATKRLLRSGTGEIREELAELSRLSTEFFNSADAQEGITAFRERRAPRWALANPG